MVKAAPATPVRLYSRQHVEALLDLEAVIAAVETGFGQLGGVDDPHAAGVLGVHAPDGVLHVKVAVFPAGPHRRLYLAAKLNANYPANPVRHGLPTIQGLLGLFDASNGTLLAIMDSASVTILRTAAATAVAARHLAAPDARVLALAGCGAQAMAQIQAIALVRPVEEVLLFDRERAHAEALAVRLHRLGAVRSEVVEALAPAALRADIVITCTTATAPVLAVSDVRPGTLIAAVGADNPAKSEISPGLMRAAHVVTDQTAQCAAIGDLHHAIAAGAMTSDDVRAELGQIVAGRWPAPGLAGRPVVFDSTGLPFQDVVTAALVHQRGRAAGVGLEVPLAGYESGQ